MCLGNINKKHMEQFERLTEIKKLVKQILSVTSDQRSTNEVVPLK